MNRAMLLVMASLLCTASAQQDLATTLPLTSVGDGLTWTVGDQDLDLDVLAAGPVRLDLYSPALDPADYRSRDFYGDESYSSVPVTTTFTLLDPAGRTVREVTFTPRAASWETLLDTPLAAGRYRLLVRTSGRGKNTFAVRLGAAGTSLRSTRPNVTVRASDWTPALRVTVGTSPMTLRVYDGDGPTELEAALRGPDGVVTPFTVAGGLEWLDLPMPRVPGDYTVLLRQPARAKQHSNTVGFVVVQEGRPVPLVLASTPAASVQTTASAPLVPEPVMPAPVMPKPVVPAPVVAVPAPAPVEPPTEPAPEPAPAEPVVETPITQAPVAQVPAETPAPAAPRLIRESDVALPYDAPDVSASVVVAHDLPVGATYLPGSATLDGQPLPDPLVGVSGRLYWTITGAPRGVVAYRVQHDGALGELAPPALLARYPRDRQELLMGRIDLVDFSGARAVIVRPTENAGLVRLPVAGTIFRDRDRVTVTVELPLGVPLGVSVNGEPLSEDIIGRRVTDEAAGTVRLDFIGVKLRAGENVIVAGQDVVRVYYAGTPARVDVRPEQLVADGSTPLRVRLRSLDEAGTPTGQPFLTVRSSVEPRVPDANPQEGGYQIRLDGGEGVLELAPQAVPTRVTLEVLLGDEVVTEVLNVTADPGEVGVGGLSVTAGLSPFGITAFSAGAYYEGMLGDGKLYVAAASAGLPTTANPNERFGVYGDASTETIPLQGVDPVAFRYEHPTFQAQYRRAAVPLDVFQLGETVTALSVTTRGETRVGGFVALLPRERVREALTPDGTRLLHLRRGDVAPDSETVELVSRDSFTGEESRRVLVRFADYTFDPQSGTLTFTQPVDRVDAALRDVRVEVTYRPARPLTERALAWGVQAHHESGPLTADAAVVHLDDVTSTGVRVRYRDGVTSAAARAAVAGGVQVGAGATYATPLTQATADVTYQSAGYVGLDRVDEGFSARASVRQTLGANLAGQLSGQYEADDVSRQGSVTALGQYSAGPLNAGLGLRASFGDTSGLSGVASVGYRARPLDLNVTHAQPLTGAASANTTFSARYALTELTSLVARNEIDWASGQRASVGLDSKLGGTNLSVAYDLPTASGAGNRARFGADTTVALNARTSLGLRGAYLQDMTTGSGEVALGTSVRYAEDRLSATAAADLSLQGGVLKTVLRGGVTGSVTDDLTLSADGTSEFGVTPGNRLSVSGAYRGDAWSALGFGRYRDGSLAGGAPEFTAGVAAEYRAPEFAARGGFDARFLPGDPESLTYQPSLGGTWYVTDTVGLGAAGRAMVQPLTGTVLFGLGLEASVRPLPGFWATLGYNVLGFEGGLGAVPTRPGLYVRLDVLLDERLGR